MDFNTLWKLTWKVYSFFYNTKRNFVLLDYEIPYDRKHWSFTKLKRLSVTLGTPFDHWISLSLVELIQIANESESLVFKSTGQESCMQVIMPFELTTIVLSS